MYNLFKHVKLNLFKDIIVLTMKMKLLTQLSVIIETLM